MNKHNVQLKKMINERIKKSFVPEFQNQITDYEALALIIVDYFDGDPLRILKMTADCMEDINYHSEVSKINGIIKEL